MAAARPRVLVVDDDVSFARLVAGALGDRNVEATAVGSPGEALELSSHSTFDAAIVDLVMPEMPGLDLADRLRVLDPDLQVVVLTGHGTLDVAVEGIQHRIFDLVEKSAVDLGRLERTVRSAAGQSQLLRQRRELMGRLQESNRLLRAMHEVSTALAAEPHLDRLLRQIVASAKRLCSAPRARALLLSRPEDRELLVTHGEGDGAEGLVGMRLKADEGLLGLVAGGDEALVFGEPCSHSHYSERCDSIAEGTASVVCAPIRHRDVLGVLTVESGADRMLSPGDRDLVAILARQAAVAVDNAHQHERATNFFVHVSELLISLLDGFNPTLAGHSRSVAALSDLASRRLGLAEADRRTVHYAALLHDLGKVRLAPGLLDGSALDADARRRVEEHPMLGFEMLRPVAYWESLLPIVRAHHERWDGTGYPLGLAADQIPLGARIVAVADAFDAMTRPVGPGPCRTPSEALADLERGAGTQFDPRVVRLFVAEYRKHGDRIVV